MARKTIVQVEKFSDIEDMNKWLAEHPSIYVKDIKYQASDHWDVFLVIYEVSVPVSKEAEQTE
jgi:hypothetical protein